MGGSDPAGGGDDRLAAVAAIAQAVAAARTPLDAARRAAAPVRRALRAAFTTVSVREPDHGRLRVLAGDGAPGEERPAGGQDAVPGPCIALPIVLHGRAWGELYASRAAGAPAFDRADTDFAAVLAAVVGSGIAQAERLEEVSRLAFTDPLTGLANRRAVDARLEEALERHRASGTPVSLVVCDVNGLKRVNDSLGHDVGDRLLVGFGSVLSWCGALLPGGLAARLGGDEFCLVADGSPAGEVERTARELCGRARLLGLGDGVAVGVASTDGGAGPVTSARRLFRLADAAQYRAKAERSAGPVMAGPAVAELADSALAARSDRRRFRGRPDPGPHRCDGPGS